MKFSFTGNINKKQIKKLAKASKPGKIYIVDNSDIIWLLKTKKNGKQQIQKINGHN